MHSCTDSLRRLFCVYVLLQVMYRKILESDLAPPAFMPADAVDICAKLLKRDPKQRLGFNGGDEIKKHPFFKGLDFDQLERKEISAPWHPGVASETDTKHIASEFTNEPAAVRCRLPLPLSNQHNAPHSSCLSFPPRFATQVSPSPAGSQVLRDAVGGTPPSFGGFTYDDRRAAAIMHNSHKCRANIARVWLWLRYTHASVLDGDVYRVSFSEDEMSTEDSDKPLVSGTPSSSADASATATRAATTTPTAGATSGAGGGAGASTTTAATATTAATTPA